MNQNEPPSLLRNDVAGKNHWLKVKLMGTTSKRNAIGARVTAKYGGKLRRAKSRGQSAFLSVSDRRLHFGLSVNHTADLEIRWPTGGRESFAKVAADQIVTSKEGAPVFLIGEEETFTF
jgi:enediyne biosynthesis protein E4